MVVLVLQWHEKLCPLVIYRQIFRGKSPMGAVFRVHQLLNRRVYCLGGGKGGDFGPLGLRRRAPVELLCWRRPYSVHGLIVLLIFFIKCVMTKTKELQLLDWHHWINLLF